MPELNNRQVVAHGTFKDICQYLHCSQTTLWRRMKDHPDHFVRIGYSQLLLVIPKQVAEQLAEAV